MNTSGDFTKQDHYCYICTAPIEFSGICENCKASRDPDRPDTTSPTVTAWSRVNSRGVYFGTDHEWAMTRQSEDPDSIVPADFLADVYGGERTG